MPGGMTYEIGEEVAVTRALGLVCIGVGIVVEKARDRYRIQIGEELVWALAGELCPVS